MNARADRAYVGIYDNGDIVADDYVSEVKDINPMDYNVVGDGELIGKEENYPNIAEAFLKTKPMWQKVENIAYLVPKYLKESESYLK